MRKGFASIAIVGVAACLAVYALTQQPQSSSLYTALSSEDMEFLKFVSLHGKSYGTKEEFEFRSQIFKKTLAVVSQENAKNENTFRVGLNKFADWTPAELKRILSYRPIRGAKKMAPVKDIVSIPVSIDWRDKNAVNTVRDQGQCGSCWAFSAVGALESRAFIQAIDKHGLLQLSEQQLVDCAGGSYGNEGCNGGDMGAAFDYAKDYGMMNRTDYPYTAQDGDCAFDGNKVTRVKPSGHTMVTPNSAAALKTAIADGPVSVAIEADTFVFQFYSGGILNSAACGTNLDHGVVAIGYGVDPSKGEYYIVRNSWGSSWGVKGYINIAIKDGAGICGIQMEPVYPDF
jgi:KDEL-tailed cysteine endopeptidase